jgi:hypothetical protein
MFTVSSIYIYISIMDIVIFLLRILLHLFYVLNKYSKYGILKIKLILFLVKANKFMLLISRFKITRYFTTIELLDSFHPLCPTLTSHGKERKVITVITGA